MAGTARKGKKSAQEPPPFVLPDSLSCSEVSFPILINRKSFAKWESILNEREDFLKNIEEFKQRGKEVIPRMPFQKTETDYVQNEVFTLLLPALEETLTKAKIWEALTIQKCFFNGIDHIAQLLWNNNPRYPVRKIDNLHIFNMPWVKEHLKENPRPYYPKSWLWPEEYAAIMIQKSFRRYLVQRDDEVQEMREFWSKLQQERDNPNIESNYFLAKEFASEHKHKPQAPKEPSQTEVTKKAKRK